MRLVWGVKGLQIIILSLEAVWSICLLHIYSVIGEYNEILRCLRRLSPVIVFFRLGEAWYDLKYICRLALQSHPQLNILSQPHGAHFLNLYPTYTLKRTCVFKTAWFIKPSDSISPCNVFWKATLEGCSCSVLCVGVVLLFIV